MNKIIKRLMVITIAITTLFLIGCEEKSEEISEIQQTSIVVEEVAIETLETVFESTGRIEASNTIKVVPEVTGALEKIYVSVDQEVKKGDKLMSIESTEVLDQADLALKQAKSQWTLAKEQADKNDKKLKDLTKLLESGAISKDAYNDMKLLHEESSQSLKIATESLKVAETAKKQINEKFNIISPIDGKVKNISGTLGSKDLSDVYVLVQGDKGYEVSIPVPEQFIKEIDLKTKGHVQVVSTGKNYEGQVIKVSQEMDMNLGLYKVKMKLLSDEDLIPSQFVRTKLLLKEERDQLTIPSLAVLLEETQKYVYTYNEEHLKKVEVTTGNYKGGRVQILSGLNKGDKIVVKGQSFIRPESQVRLVQD